jgi:hypothetical protein
VVRVEEAKDLSGCHPEGAAAKHPEGALALKDVARGICFSRQKFGALAVPAAAGRRAENGRSFTLLPQAGAEAGAVCHAAATFRFLSEAVRY